MPRQETLDARLYCGECKDYTKSIGPIIIIIKLIKIR